MTIISGTRLGPYEILTPLGAGGMGEVFKARDTRLDRSVAIKILPEGFAPDGRTDIHRIGGSPFPRPRAVDQRQ